MKYIMNNRTSKTINIANLYVFYLSISSPNASINLFMRYLNVPKKI